MWSVRAGVPPCAHMYVCVHMCGHVQACACPCVQAYARPGGAWVLCGPRNHWRSTDRQRGVELDAGTSVRSENP